MVYYKYKPCEALEMFVECYFVWASEKPIDSLLKIESPPSGYCSLVFNYGDAYHLQNKKYDKLPVPLQFISGQSIYSYTLFLQGTISIAGIVLKPAALGTLFNWPMYEYVEERVDLYNLFSKAIVDQYSLDIRSCTDEKEKAALLEKFMLHQFSMLKPQPDYIDEAANLIVEKNGMLQVAELLEGSFMSRRTFERKFLQKVGLSPKYYARIRRIGYICNLISGRKKVDWPAIFYECDFYDQAHFIKDFEEFTGRTPQQYLKENTELSNYVKKPSPE